MLAIDYRGYGDSDGSPSEAGLAKDARAAWDFVIDNGAKPEDVVIVGQSLGTGVSSKLVYELSQEGMSYSFFYNHADAQQTQEHAQGASY